MLPAVCCALVITLCAANAWAEGSRVVAVVGDDVITSLDVDKIVGVMEAQVSAASAAHPGEAVPTKTQLRRMAVDRLIEDKIFDQEVKRANVSVNNAEIDHYIDRIKTANQLNEEEFKATLSRRGLTPEEYRQDLRREILKHKLVERSVKSRVVISDKEVDEYYRLQQGESAPAEPSKEIRLRAIFLNIPEGASPAAVEALRKQAEDLRKKVAGGDDFAEAARRYSQGPGASQGGELGPVAESDLLPEMRKTIAQLKSGQVSQVIKLPESFAFLQLMGQTTAISGGAPGLSPHQREQIRVKLEQEALDKRFRDWLSELRGKVYIKEMQ